MVPLREHEEKVPTSAHRTKPSQKAESKEPARRSNIKCPKVNEAEAWHKLDTDLTKILEGSLEGGMESKLNLFGDILYQAHKDRFGKVNTKQRTATREKGRR